MKTFLEAVIDIPRRTYAPGVFNNSDTSDPTLKPSVKKMIYDQIEEFEKEYPVLNVSLIGSILTHRYRNDADLDINVLFDVPKEKQEEERERLTLQAQELMKLDPPLQQTAPVIELLVAGVPRIIYGVGKTGFNLINTLAKESVKKPKPVNYYHGSNLKLKEVTPMGDRATSPDVKDLFQQASYIAKPGDRGLELANFYARGGGFVNVIGKKQFDEVVKKLYNPRNISDELKDKVTKQISMRQAFINKAKTEKVNRNKLGRARREIVDLENLIKPFGSGYISRITPVQRKFLEREGFDGVDVSDDVVAIFRKVPVKSSIRGSLTQRLINRRNARQSKINE